MAGRVEDHWKEHPVGCKLTDKTKFFNKVTGDRCRQTIMNMSENSKVIHMKKKFPHGWHAACGREITSNTSVVSSWSKVTCKNCKLKQVSHANRVHYSRLSVGIMSESL